MIILRVSFALLSGRFRASIRQQFFTRRDTIYAGREAFRRRGTRSVKARSELPRETGIIKLYLNERRIA